MKPLYPYPTLNIGAEGLQVEGIPLAQVAATYGTPCYVYSRHALTEAYEAYRQALAQHPNTICYAVKANSNLGILSLFARLGAGFDIVSGGELSRVLAAGGSPSKVVFSGVGKSTAEMQAALEAGIGCFNIESSEELERLNDVAGSLGRTAPIAFRVNPNVDPKTHPYISTGLRSNKFGVAFEQALPLYRKASALPHIRIKGIACHIGSQLLDPAPACEAAEKILGLVDELKKDGIPLEHIDLGGGLGIRYKDEQAPTPASYLGPILELFAGRPEALHIEPGRSLIGNAGLLLTRVEYLKHGEEKNFAIVDAAMNDLARPALYDAYHEVVEVQPGTAAAIQCDVVGPICESGDFLAKDRSLRLNTGDLLAILSAGAYGMTMSSNYNTRPRAAEVVIDDSVMNCVRQREEVTALFALESLLPD